MCDVVFPRFFPARFLGGCNCVLCIQQISKRKSGAQTGNDVPNQMEMDKEKYDGNGSKKGTCRSLNQPIPEKYPADEKMVP